MALFPAHSVYKAHNPGPPFSPQIRSPRVYVYTELPGSFPLISASLEYKYVGFKAGWYNQSMNALRGLQIWDLRSRARTILFLISPAQWILI